MAAGVASWGKSFFSGDATVMNNVTAIATHTATDPKSCVASHCYWEFLECGLDSACSHYLYCGSSCHGKGQTCFLQCLTSIKGQQNDRMLGLFQCGKDHHCFPLPHMRNNSVDTTCDDYEESCRKSSVCTSWLSCATNNSCELTDAGCIADCTKPSYALDHVSRRLIYCSVYDNIPFHMPGQNATTNGYHHVDTRDGALTTKYILILSALLTLLTICVACCCRCCCLCCCWKHQCCCCKPSTDDDALSPTAPLFFQVDDDANAMSDDGVVDGVRSRTQPRSLSQPVTSRA